VPQSEFGRSGEEGSLFGSGGCRTSDRPAHSLTDITNTSTRRNVNVSRLQCCGRSDSDEHKTFHWAHA